MFRDCCAGTQSRHPERAAFAARAVIVSAVGSEVFANRLAHTVKHADLRYARSAA
jgi:hypothetical protein